MAWFSSSWLKRKSIDVSASMFGSDLTNFTVKVPLDAEILAGAHPSGRDILFTAADQVTQLSHELEAHTFITDTSATWFNGDHGVYHNGTYRRVFGTGMSGSSVVAFHVDLDTKEVARGVVKAGLEFNDHDGGGIIVRASDSKLAHFYCKHASDTTMRFAVSTAPEDASAWGSEQTFTFGHNVSYTNAYELPADGDAVYVFCRLSSPANKWSYRRSADYSTWDAQVDFWVPSAGQCYARMVRHGDDEFHFFVSDGHPDNTPGYTSLYHFYCKWDVGTGALKWYDSDSVEQTLPMTTANATLVHDGVTPSEDGWQIDIAIGSDGYPRILYQVRVDETEPTDHRLMYRRWTGSAWTTATEVCALGPGHVTAADSSHTGVACFDGNDTDIVFASVVVSGAYEVQKLHTTDSGATWSKLVDITSGSDAASPNIRPWSPKGHDADCEALYQSGDYGYYTSFYQNTHIYPPLAIDAHVKLPTASSSTDTRIWCYFDNQAAADQQDITGAWDSNYLYVHHMRPRAGFLAPHDSTSNAAHTTRKSQREPYDAPDGQLFDGSNDYLDNSVTTINGRAALTTEVFINSPLAGSTGDGHTIIGPWQGTPTKAAIYLRAAVAVDGGAVTVHFLAEPNAPKGGAFGGSVTANVPTYIGAVYDGTTVRGNVNETEGGSTFSTGGALMDSTANDSIRYGQTPHFIGREFGGTIYEARLSKVARSADWRSATSRTLRNPLAFLTFGSEETDGISVSLTEAASASAAPAGTAAWAASISAATAAAETISAALGALDVATVAQATATDTAAASAVLQVANIGAAGATDTLAAGASLQVAVIGAAGATTTLSASFDVAGASSVTEVATAADLVTAAAVVAALVSADASADDDLLAAAEVLCLVAEAVSAAATASASLPVTVDVSVAELATALDTIAAALGGLYPTPGFSAGLPGRRWTAVLDSKGTAR
jgi:hypothetical protein